MGASQHDGRGDCFLSVPNRLSRHHVWLLQLMEMVAICMVEQCVPFVSEPADIVVDIVSSSSPNLRVSPSDTPTLFGWTDGET